MPGPTNKPEGDNPKGDGKGNTKGDPKGGKTSTKGDAKAKGIPYEKGVFPWAASGKALSNGRSEGMTKLLFNPEDQRVIGGCIVGVHAGDLIAEVGLAIEMGADAVDLGHTIHAHPTLSETVNFAAEMFEGTITDLMPPKKKKH